MHSRYTGEFQISWLSVFGTKQDILCKFLNQNQNQRCWRKLIFKLSSVSSIHPFVAIHRSYSNTQTPRLGSVHFLKTVPSFWGKCQRLWLSTAASSLEGSSWLPATAAQQPPPSGTRADFCLLWTKISPSKSGLREANPSKHSEEHLVLRTL